MSVGVAGQAIVLFAVTNIDDIMILALFFAHGAGRRHHTRTIAAGQYLGFAGILVVAVAAASGAALLPERMLPYLGLLPLALGVKAGVQAWRSRGRAGEDEQARPATGILDVAAVTFANGGDNIGVYVPVFATAGAAAVTVYVLVFLVLVGVWVAAGRFFAGRAPVARTLSRWGHVVLPVVLIALGLLILSGAW
ncbi:cadmium resistance transporter [Actinoplanes sp. NPDC023801]|uniref:cadmium resistance transporter n=1 Tax=Actinoplanes sp. NPDC023801 TaxID=3154595 RepID=UPI0033ECE26B